MADARTNRSTPASRCVALRRADFEQGAQHLGHERVERGVEDADRLLVRERAPRRPAAPYGVRRLAIGAVSAPRAVGKGVFRVLRFNA